MLHEENLSMDEVKSELQDFIEVSVVSSWSFIDHIYQCLSHLDVEYQQKSRHG